MELAMLKRLLLAATALTASTAALADPGYWAPAHGWRAHHARPYFYYAPRPVYVVPAPRYVYAPPPPVAYPYYAAPVVVRPVPVYPPAAVYSAPGVSFRLDFPL